MKYNKENAYNGELRVETTKTRGSQSTVMINCYSKLDELEKRHRTRQSQYDWATKLIGLTLGRLSIANFSQVGTI